MPWEADTIPTDAVPTDDRDRVRVLGRGLVGRVRVSNVASV